MLPRAHSALALCSVESFLVLPRPANKPHPLWQSLKSIPDCPSLPGCIPSHNSSGRVSESDVEMGTLSQERAPGDDELANGTNPRKCPVPLHGPVRLRAGPSRVGSHLPAPGILSTVLSYVLSV